MRKHLYWLIGLLVIGVVFGAVQFLNRAQEIPWVIAEYATCEATVTDQAGVDATSAFRLNFDGDVNVNAVRNSMTVEPEIELAYHPGRRGSEVLLVPAEPLQENSTYHFTLATERGPVYWSFQTKREWSVSGASPEHAATTVSPAAQIEFYLNQSLDADLNEIADYLTVEPYVAGSYSQSGHILRFTPDQPLAANTVYRVQLSAGLPAALSDLRLAAGFAFAFETGNPDGLNPSPIWEVKAQHDTYASGEQPVFSATFHDNPAPPPTEEEEQPDGEGVEEEPLRRTVSATLYRYPDAAAYAADWLAFLESAPPWSKGAAYPQGAAIAGLEMLSYQPLELVEDGAGCDFSWPAALHEGCYLLQLSYQGQARDIRFQISSLTAYVLAAQGQSLIWAHDLQNGEPLSDSSVTYFNSAQRISTDADGLALFNLNRELSAYNKEQTLLAKQDVYLIEEDERALVLLDTGLVEAENARAVEANSWHYIYLDRDTYQSGDTLRYWGFLKRRDNQSWEYSRVGIRLISEDRPDQPVVQEYATLNNDIISGEFELPQLLPGRYTLQIRQSGQVWATKTFSVGRSSQLSSAAVVTPGEGATVLSLDQEAYALDDPYAVTLRPQTADASYLFYRAASGFQDAVIQEQPTYLGTFTDNDYNGAYIGGVLFDGSSYQAAAPVLLPAQAAQRQLTLSISKDQEVYEPGDTATFQFHVANAEGEAATQAGLLVIVTSSVVPPQDPLESIYQAQLTSGLLDIHTDISLSTRRRSSSARTLSFELLELDKDGQAQLEIELPDDQWNLYAVAVQSDEQPWAAVAMLSNLMQPQEVQLQIATQERYQENDQPHLILSWQNLPELYQERQLHYELTLSGPQGQSSYSVQDGEEAYVELEPLVEGSYRVQATARLGLTEYQAEASFEVGEQPLRLTFYEAERLNSDTLMEGQELILISSPERVEALRMIYQTLSNPGITVEERLAAAYATLLWQHYAPESQIIMQEENYPLLRNFQDSSGAILNRQGNVDLQLSMLTAALVRDGLAVFDRHALAAYFRQVYESSNLQRDRARALAGLAALDEPVLQEIKLLLAQAQEQPYLRLLLIWGLTQAGDLQVAKTAFESFWADYTADATAGSVYLEGGQGENIILNQLAVITAAACGDFSSVSHLLTYLEKLEAVEPLIMVLGAGQALPSLYPQSFQISASLGGRRQQLSLDGQEDIWLEPAAGQSFRYAETTEDVAVAGFRAQALRLAAETASLLEEEGEEPEIRVERSYQLLYQEEQPLGLLEVQIRYQFAEEFPAGSYTLVEFPPALSSLTSLSMNSGHSWRIQDWSVLITVQKPAGQSASGTVTYQLPVSYVGGYQIAPAWLLNTQGQVLYQSPGEQIEVPLSYLRPPTEDDAP